MDEDQGINKKNSDECQIYHNRRERCINSGRDTEMDASRINPKNFTLIERTKCFRRSKALRKLHQLCNNLSKG